MKPKRNLNVVATNGTQEKAIPKLDPVRRRRNNIQVVQNVQLIWLDNNIDENNIECQNTITQIRHILNNINTFTDENECIQFLNEIVNDKACMIISGSLGQTIMPFIHNMPQVDSIFIFCANKTYHEEWVKEWSKIKGVFTEIVSICDALKQAAQQCEQNVTPISFMATNDNISKKKLDQLDPSFMYTQILKEILLMINFEEQHIQEFIEYCYDILNGNERELKNVKKLKDKYHDQTAIWWYTYESFLYPMLNRALRIMDTDIIIKLGFFINDLHRHIEQLHKEQYNGQNLNESLTVYRGQGMSKDDFKKMTDTKGGLLAFNCFLSTSTNRNISLRFAQHSVMNPDIIGILFVMTINPCQSTTPFASVGNVGHLKNNEEEILFSMHTVFRIIDIIPMDENQRLFQVNLTLTSDNDTDLCLLTNRIRETTNNLSGWMQLAELLVQMGQSKKAQEVYEILLKQTTNELEQINIYHKILWTKSVLGEYNAALTLYEKINEIQEKLLPPDHRDFATLYTHIGAVYYHMDECPKALSYYEKALAIDLQSLPPNHPSLSTSYNNLGTVYHDIGNYSQALWYFEKTLETEKETLLPNHPDLAVTYGNMANAYDGMGEYSKALSSHQKHLIFKNNLFLQIIRMWLSVTTTLA